MKNIIVCCDGTGNEYGDNNTNVVLTYEVALQNENQLSFYDPGVGTGGWEYNEGTNKLKAVKDQATGSGLVQNIEDAYRLLMATYEPGDRVYLFGFSRGAFTVRSLAGMLNKCGLLESHHENLVSYASKLYNTKKNKKVASGFKATFGRRCPVHFLGVWDTVESLVFNGAQWHDDKLNPEVKHAYHAVSIDERRKDFPPSLWGSASIADRVKEGSAAEVWFPGVHCDVGGWYKERGLSNAAFQWMMARAIEAEMEVNTTKLAKHVPNPHDKIHESYEGFWFFRGESRRKIPKGARIHQSVVDRMNRASKKYEPPNLPMSCKVVS